MKSITSVEIPDKVSAQEIGPELFNRFIAYLDTTPKTTETYTKPLRQLFNYFSLEGIRRPKREDIISFREKLNESGHKPTTIQNYITAARLFFSWTAQEGYHPNIAQHLKGGQAGQRTQKGLSDGHAGKGSFGERKTRQLERV